MRCLCYVHAMFAMAVLYSAMFCYELLCLCYVFAINAMKNITCCVAGLIGAAGPDDTVSVVQQGDCGYRAPLIAADSLLQAGQSHYDRASCSSSLFAFATPKPSIICIDKSIIKMGSYTGNSTRLRIIKLCPSVNAIRTDISIEKYIDRSIRNWHNASPPDPK